MKLEECLKRIKCPFDCDVRWHEDDGEGGVATTIINVDKLYRDWYDECRHCPENEAIVYEVIFCDYEGRTFMVEENMLNGVNFETVMRAIEKRWYDGDGTGGYVKWKGV